MLESPRIQGVIETCLYVADLGCAIDFYERILALRRLVADDRMAVFSVADRQLLLLFRTGATPTPILTSGGIIPQATATALDCPDARGQEFDQVSIGVTKIEAPAATGPFDAALDRDARFLEPGFPGGQVSTVDGEAKIAVSPGTPVRRP